MQKIAIFVTAITVTCVTVMTVSKIKKMKFYDREPEIKLLQDVSKSLDSGSKLTVITGRRRIGKTKLILKTLENTTFLYFFIARKSERLLCEEFIREIWDKLKLPVYGEITEFKDIFALLMDVSKNQKINVVIDEFQEFERINPSIFSEIQNTWDRNKDNTSMHLVVSGSIYSIMKRLFEHAKEPLFGRASERIYLQPFSVDIIKQILNENTSNYSNRDLLAFYSITGGVPKYVELFVDKGITDFQSILNEIFRENGYLLEEGKNLLIEEFGKDYTMYFSILTLLSSSKTSRSEMESVLGKSIGGFLGKLEKDYNLIQKIKPIFSKEGSRNYKYKINDRFVRFWFRFIYKYRSAIEIENYDYVKKIVKRDFSTFAGEALETYFKEKLKITGLYSMIGSYWEKGNKNEIDIVAINENEKKALIAEVKMNKDKISKEKLIDKSTNLRTQIQNYAIEYQTLSLEDM